MPISANIINLASKQQCLSQCVHLQLIKISLCIKPLAIQ